MTVGSWAYMAPERLSDDHTTKAADIYALACVLYEILTGARPFAIDSMQQVINAHLHTPPPRVSAANARVPAALDAVIERGMAKEPDDRYGSAGALARAAQRALSAPPARDANATMAAAHVLAPTEQHTRVAPPPPPPEPVAPQPVAPARMSRPIIIGIAVCAALLLAAAGIVIGVLAGQSGSNDSDNTAQNPSLTRLSTPERAPLPTGRRPTAPPPQAPPPRRLPPAGHGCRRPRPTVRWRLPGPGQTRS